jgi:hypothetical protein
MGAVTCIRYAEDNAFQLCNMVSGLNEILDSPFTSLIKMCQDVAREHYSIPKFLINLGIGIINGSIQSRIEVDLFQELIPLDSSKGCCVNFTYKDSCSIHHWPEGWFGNTQASESVHERVWIKLADELQYR